MTKAHLKVTSMFDDINAEQIFIKTNLCNNNEKNYPIRIIFFHSYKMHDNSNIMKEYKV